MSQVTLMVDDPSQVSTARRAAAELGTQLGFDEATGSNLAIAVTETASNLLKHAGNGRILIRPLSVNGADGARGIEVLAIDRGPGMQNVGNSMRDGHSTAGSAGNGLGAISRLASNMEIYSTPGKGTAMRFEVWPPQKRMAAPAVETGAVSIPMRGETVCGDAWAVSGAGRHYTVVVADGLGHGEHAAAASQAALAVLTRHADYAPANLIEAMHGALASTRGAAVAAAALDLESGRGLYCGVGNISGITYVNHKPKNLVSHNGTLGHNARRIQQFEFDFPKNSMLIMFSDGLVTHWNLEDYPGLAGKHPGLIAGVLYRDHDRGRDDVTVTVLKSTAG
jgi:anti-sigma regulatory factor (Ser/Thr protein kinase)